MVITIVRNGRIIYGWCPPEKVADMLKDAPESVKSFFDKTGWHIVTLLPLQAPPIVVIGSWVETGKAAFCETSFVIHTNPEWFDTRDYEINSRAAEARFKNILNRHKETTCTPTSQAS